MSQAIPALAVLSYDVAPSRQPMSAARVAGWFSFVAVAVAGLYGPILFEGEWVQGHIVDPSTNYQNICKIILPVAQAFLTGTAGVLLFIAQRHGRRGYRLGWVFALCLTVISVGLIAGELTHNLRNANQQSLVRWVTSSSTMID
jgi:hypothetical protein